VSSKTRAFPTRIHANLAGNGNQTAVNGKHIPLNRTVNLFFQDIGGKRIVHSSFEKLVGSMKQWSMWSTNAPLQNHAPRAELDRH
jgi:hypothetical protein